MELTRSKQAVLARFAHLTGVLKLLERELTLYDDAEAIYRKLSKAQRDKAEGTTADPSMDSLVMLLARMDPAERAERRAALEHSITTLRELLMDGEFTFLRYAEHELHVIAAFIESLDMLETKSMRDLKRFYDTLEHGDSGVAVIVSVPGRKQKLEVRFADSITEETRKVLHLPNLYSAKSRQI